MQTTEVNDSFNSAVVNVLKTYTILPNMTILLRSKKYKKKYSRKHNISFSTKQPRPLICTSFPIPYSLIILNTRR